MTPISEAMAVHICEHLSAITITEGLGAPAYPDVAQVLFRDMLGDAAAVRSLVSSLKTGVLNFDRELIPVEFGTLCGTFPLSVELIAQLTTSPRARASFLERVLKSLNSHTAEIVGDLIVLPVIRYNVSLTVTPPTSHNVWRYIGPFIRIRKIRIIIDLVDGPSLARIMADMVAYFESPLFDALADYEITSKGTTAEAQILRAYVDALLKMRVR